MARLGPRVRLLLDERLDGAETPRVGLAAGEVARERDDGVVDEDAEVRLVRLRVDETLEDEAAWCAALGSQLSLFVWRGIQARS